MELLWQNDRDNEPGYVNWIYPAENPVNDKYISTTSIMVEGLRVCAHSRTVDKGLRFEECIDCGIPIDNVINVSTSNGIKCSKFEDVLAEME